MASDLVVARNRKSAYNMWVMGATAPEISEKLGVKEDQVYAYLKKERQTLLKYLNKANSDQILTDLVNHAKKRLKYLWRMMQEDPKKPQNTLDSKTRVSVLNSIRAEDEHLVKLCQRYGLVAPDSVASVMFQQNNKIDQKIDNSVSINIVTPKSVPKAKQIDVKSKVIKNNGS